MHTLKAFGLPILCLIGLALAVFSLLLASASWSELPHILKLPVPQYAMASTAPAVREVISGVVAGSYEFAARDAKGNQVYATAGNPGSIAGNLECPVTLVARARLVTKTPDGVSWSVSVDDGQKPAGEAPFLAAASSRGSNQYTFDISIARAISPQSAKNKRADFDVHYADDGTPNTFKWPVLLDITCSNGPRIH